MREAFAIMYTLLSGTLAFRKFLIRFIDRPQMADFLKKAVISAEGRIDSSHALCLKAARAFRTRIVAQARRVAEYQGGLPGPTRSPKSCRPQTSESGAYFMAATIFFIYRKAL
jgi:hypothetical protein